jgi:hypothetical protein
MPTDHRLKIIFTLIFVAIIAVFNFAPIAQDTAYHRFADQRTVFGIAHFYNVISNLPFVIIGLMGMRLMSIRLMARPDAAGGLAGLNPLYLIFFTGVFLTGFGSSYYHYYPDNQTLLWDRLPMTISFMAFFSAIVGEYISTRWALKIAVPLLALGLVSVIYWQVTERHGHGDLRLYALVQFLPMILIPVILWLFTPVVNLNDAVWGLIAVYALSKISEFYDAGLFSVLGLLSGHSIKHLFAAFGALIIYWALRDREDGLEERP